MEKAVVVDDDDLVLRLLMLEGKKEKVKNNFGLWRMLKCLQRLVGDYGTLCHITNNYTGLFDVTKIYKMGQGSSGSMPATKKGKLCINVHQVNGVELV